MQQRGQPLAIAYADICKGSAIGHMYASSGNVAKRRANRATAQIGIFRMDKETWRVVLDCLELIVINELIVTAWWLVCFKTDWLVP